MKVYITGDNVISSLGFNTEENMDNLFKGITGIHKIDRGYLSPEPIPAALVDSGKLEAVFSNIASPTLFTRLEQMMILSVKQAAESSGMDLQHPRSLLIVSTTKGNVELLEKDKKTNFPQERVYLWGLAKLIKDYFKLYHTPLVVSNACISGLLAIEVGARLIQSGQYDQVAVVGGDILTPFVVSGFQSFKSLSPEPCKPYDANRDGLSLGEACATIILSSQMQNIDNRAVVVAGGASSNDANHISGPSRTGDGLFIAIKNALSAASLAIDQIDFICAHGTATPYNDDMESKAVNLAGMQEVPLNSLKGYIGHTLGAAGTIESIVSVRSLLKHKLIKTLGFNTLGVAEKIKIISETKECELNNCLKVASGFGGCNAAVIFSVV
jgi:3-oxoacyl-[acyl-carrier-protein] synthase I